MKVFFKTVCASLLIFSFFSCRNNKNNFDASGTFEADEIIVSAEQTGKIIQLNIEEGQLLDSNSIVGQIDVSALNIQKEQVNASIAAIGEKVNNAAPQISVLQSQVRTQQAQIETLNQQLAVLNKEVIRTQHLLEADAATPKQLDDITGQRLILQKQIHVAQEQLSVLNQQIIAASENVNIQNKGIMSEVNPTQKKAALLDEQISRGQIKNSITGTVLSKYAMAGEYTNTGKALYKIANLSVITLRTYITANQLSLVKLNQQVKVNTDDGKGGFKEALGTITWINDKAEFTPKTIQTKDERANMVYAVRVKLKNDGTYKIGMYGEIKFH